MSTKDKVSFDVGTGKQRGGMPTAKLPSPTSSAIVVGEITDSAFQAACRKQIADACDEIVVALNKLYQLGRSGSDYVDGLSCSAAAQNSLQAMVGNVSIIQGERRTVERLKSEIMTATNGSSGRNSNRFVILPEGNEIAFVTPITKFDFKLLSEWLEGKSFSFEEKAYRLKFVNDRSTEALALITGRVPERVPITTINRHLAAPKPAVPARAGK